MHFSPKIVKPVQGPGLHWILHLCMQMSIRKTRKKIALARL